MLAAVFDDFDFLSIGHYWDLLPLASQNLWLLVTAVWAHRFTVSLTSCSEILVIIKKWNKSHTAIWICWRGLGTVWAFWIFKIIRHGTHRLDMSAEWGHFGPNRPNAKDPLNTHHMLRRSFFWCSGDCPPPTCPMRFLPTMGSGHGSIRAASLHARKEFDPHFLIINSFCTGSPRWRSLPPMLGLTCCICSIKSMSCAGSVLQRFERAMQSQLSLWISVRLWCCNWFYQKRNHCNSMWLKFFGTSWCCSSVHLSCMIFSSPIILNMLAFAM